MRRWNGWGDDAIEVGLPPGSAAFLEREIGSGRPPRDVTFEATLATVPPSRAPHASTRRRRCRGPPPARPRPVVPRLGGPALGAPRLGPRRGRPSGHGRGRPRAAALGGRDGHGARPVRRRNERGRPHHPPGRRGPHRHGRRWTASPRSSTWIPPPAWRRSGPGSPDRLSRRRSASTGRRSATSPSRSTTRPWAAGSRPVRRASSRAATAGSRTCSRAATSRRRSDRSTCPRSRPRPPVRTCARRSWVPRAGSGSSPGRPSASLPCPSARPGRPSRCRTWSTALAAARELAQARLPLSMIRLQTAPEARTTLALGRPATDDRAAHPLPALARRRPGTVPPLPGPHRTEQARRRRAAARSRRSSGGMGRCACPGRSATPGSGSASAPRTCATRSGTPGTRWTRSRPRPRGRPSRDSSRPSPRPCRRGLEADGERVHAFSHLSHVYPSGSSIYTTYLFRLSADPDANLERWGRLKAAASAAIVAGGGTISHQHGVGRDHAPYLAAEKGAPGDGRASVIGRDVRPGWCAQPRRPAR